MSTTNAKANPPLLLSVRLMVYNNLPYIREALDGIFIQQTNFKFEVVIGDDFSTDGTLEILQEYHQKYSDIIKILDRPAGGNYQTNRKKLGRIHNFVDIVNHCKGKYIAILDGDDYWTDPLKLQKQVDFLEKNPNFSICYHPVTELFEDGTTKITNADEPEEYHATYLLEKGWHIRSVSVVFRKSDLPVWPKWVYQIESMDYATQFLLTKNGQKIKCLKGNMGIYRIHSNNVSSKMNNNYIKVLNRNRQLLKHFQKETINDDLSEILLKRLKNINTNLFYQLRDQNNKSFSDIINIVNLAYVLGKLNPFKYLSKNP